MAEISIQDLLSNWAQTFSSCFGNCSVIEDRHVAPTGIVAQFSFFNIVIFMKHSNMLINYCKNVLKVNSGSCLSLIFCGLNIR